ncbi:MAG: Sec-independent protein translocase protein TatB [Sphingomonadaceae bacterium]|uniref:Sec-independent protein translocase protein TatB n=1 Tax=Thermaurantiacus sp. TaxID=2820283 RepID=UPI00298F17E5|nr:Sec-independent protein translocase protein TatB [Thermaurantiacus sp.]MCS6987670.1 Sec-independent protein translocase protein TatB [Sphingomonadaceae bacterium]MDW8415271.1 Sec-independent protein translocase protein TatB [Thermaurantiacus sp.]
MFDLGWSELLLIGAVALVVIGPRELPQALRWLGRMTGKARAMTRHVRAGFDEMVRQAELEEMEKEWRRHNAAVMAAGPPDAWAPPTGPPLGHGPTAWAPSDPRALADPPSPPAAPAAPTGPAAPPA